MRMKSEDEETPQVQMAPMIDCMFLLLIFFILVATMRKPHMELPVSLQQEGNKITKEGAAKSADKKVPDLVIQVKGGNRFQVFEAGKEAAGGEAAAPAMDLKRDALITKIPEMLTDSGFERRIYLDVNQNLAYEEVASTIELLRKIGHTGPLGLRAIKF